MAMPTPANFAHTADTLVEEFFEDSWAVYAAILDHNYMFHREIYRNVRQLIADRFAGRSFSLLDLGCGSARHLAGALEGRPLTRYLGYDISTVALDEARTHLEALGCLIELRQGDLSEALSNEPAHFDIIFSSFAMHHLTTAQKRAFFKLAADRLANRGLLILIDVMREEGEDRAAYLDRYCGWMETSWTALSRAALAAVSAHIRESDFPETPSDLQRMAQAAGLERMMALPAYRFHHTLVFDSRN
jgi:SAM-dependent methyltransferase